METTDEAILEADDEFDECVPFSVAPLRDAEEYFAIPGVEVATSFAESLNMQSINRLKATLDNDVEYSSDWTNQRLVGRWNVLNWFARRFSPRPGGKKYHAQLVVLPDGNAAVLTEIKPTGESALVTFVSEDGIAVEITVTTMFDRHKLRETLYFPPEA